MDLRQKVVALLNDEQGNPLILELDKPWEDVRDILFSILLDNGQIDIWYDVCAFIYSSIGKGKDWPVDQTIALLYTCLEVSEQLDENVVWSITKDLKKIEYLADYDPYKDEPVVDEMKKINRG